MYAKKIIGIDEAGRGPLFGPVCAVALTFIDEYNHEFLNDSKKISAKKREIVFNDLKAHSIYEIVFIQADIIDKINIREATLLAMKLAREKLLEKLDGDFFTIVDGNALPAGFDENCKAIIKADQIYKEVMAASIVAKVSRDELIIKLAKEYPNYLLEKHKGYGTKEHYQKIREFGISNQHRKSFLRNL